MKTSIIAVLFLALVSFGQAGPVFVVINFLPPALDADGNTIAFGSTVSPDGTLGNNNDLYVGGSKLVENVTSVGLTSDGSRAVFTGVVAGGETVATVDTTTRVVKQLNIDTEGCVQPELLCPGCFFSCVATPHATVDGARILYAVRRNQPFYVVNSDGTGLVHLPTYSGTLAPAPQRVISANGRMAFTSAAPSGPTFAAAATDVYLMDLDGGNLQNLTKFGNRAIFAASAAISADGSTLVFETNYSGNAKPAPQTQVWVVRQDGTGLQQLSAGSDAAGNPSISADAKTAVFVQSGLIDVVRLDSNGQPLGQPVPIATFKFSTSQSPVISDDGLRVAFLAGPANSAGAVYQVNADGTNLTATYAPRAVSPNGVVSAAGVQLQPSPGGIFSVYGINFANDAITEAAGFPIQDVLAGASVTVNGSKVPIISVSPWQINALLPQETPAQSGNFQVSFVGGVVTPAQTANVVSSAPDLFLLRLQSDQNGLNQAAAFHAGTGIPVDDEHPAHVGDMLEMYGTGLGVTDPPVPAGQPSPSDPAAHTVQLPGVQIGDVPAQVLFAGLTPGFAGLYQVNIVVPDGLKSGRYSVTLDGNSPTAGGLGTIAIE